MIQLQSRGMLRISGTLRAPGGRIEAARGADPVVGIQLQKGGLSNSIWLDGQARLDVAGISATGIDTAGRQYGCSGTADASRWTANRDPPGAVLDASGTRMDVDVPMPGAAAVRTRIGGKGGEIALSATAGLYLDGDMRAAGGTPDAPGGKLSLRLETPLYDAGTPDEMIRPRELVVAQAGGASLLPVGARPDSVTLSYGQGRIGVDQILAGGFDEVSLMARDLVTFDGNVDLGLRRAINLYEGALGNTRAGATVRLAAPYVLLSGRTSLLPRRLRLCRYSPRWKNGGRQGRDAARLGVEADHIDIRDFVRTGIQGAVTLNGGMTQTVDRRGYGLVELRSRGDLRFLSSTAATPASLPFGGFPSAGAMLASGDLLFGAAHLSRDGFRRPRGGRRQGCEYL